MFRKLDHDSELGKQVSAFISKSKEEEHMTKKFTEEEYKKIVDCFNRFNREDNMGILNPNVIIHFQEELGNDFNLINDWSKIVAIMNPRTRDGAHEQFVEKEKKYYWRHKKKDDDGDSWYLKKSSGIICLTWLDYEKSTFTETEIIEAGYKPDMFEKEEVE